jgi:hypothetical protein
MSAPTPLSELKRLGAAVERRQITMADAAAELLAFYGGEGLRVTLTGVEHSLKHWRTDGMDPELLTAKDWTR